MNRARTAVVAALVAVVAGGWDLLRSPDPDVEAGNRHYQAGAWEDALAAYRRAQGGAGGDDGDAAGAAGAAGAARPAVDFAIGAALYQLSRLAWAAADDGLDDIPGDGSGDPGDSSGSAEAAAALAGAEAAFRRATQARDPRLKGLAYYNLGNTLFQGKQLDEAAWAYRRALRIDSHNDDARYNLELVQRLREKDAPPPAQSGGQQGGDPGDGQDQAPGTDGLGEPPAAPDDSPVEPRMEPGDTGDEAQGQPGDDQAQGQDGKDSQGQDGKDSQGQDGKDSQGQDGKDSQGQDGKDSQGQDGKDSQEGADPDDPSRPKSDPSQSERPGDARGDRPTGESAESEIERKLDALERGSRALRQQRFRNAGRSHRSERLRSQKDW